MFDWTSIDSDPANTTSDVKWKEQYDNFITKFILFTDDDRDNRVANAITQFGRKILDVGFAEHGIERARKDHWFHRKLRNDINNDVSGMDLNHEAVEKIRNEFNYERLYSGNASDADIVIADGGFDVIHAGDIIEHLSNLEGFFEFCRNNLRPGGGVVITTPNPSSIPRIIRFAKFGGLVANFEHVSWITPTNINELCRRYNFEFVSSIYAVRNVSKSFILKMVHPLAFRLRDLYFDEFLFVIKRCS